MACPLLLVFATVLLVLAGMYYFTGGDLRFLNPLNTQVQPAQIVAPETGVSPATSHVPISEPVSTEATGVAAAPSNVTGGGQPQAIEGYPVSPSLKRPMTGSGPEFNEDWVGQYQYPRADKLGYNMQLEQIQPNPVDGKWPSELQQ